MKQYTEQDTHVAASLALCRPPYTEINYFKRMANWGRPVHLHETFYQFLFVVSGRLIIEVEDTKCELCAGDVSIIPPFVSHRVYTDTGYEQVGVNLSNKVGADETGLQHLLQDYAKNCLFMYCPEQMPKAEQLIKLLETESLFTTTGARLLVSQMVLESLEKYIFGKEERFDIEVSRYLSEHLADNLTLNKIASHFHISIAQLERKSKMYFGVGIISLYNQKRYVFAITQLRQTKLSISEIAQSIGFDDNSNFSAFISKRSGRSPSMIRKHTEWKV